MLSPNLGDAPVRMMLADDMRLDAIGAHARDLGIAASLGSSVDALREAKGF
jgi:hypothetical protein